MTTNAEINIVTTVLLTGYIAYNYWIYKKYGLLPSVSNSFYKLRDDRKSGWFRVFIVCLSSCVVAIAGVSQDIPNSWPFLVAGAGGFLVYAAAEYNKNKMVEIPHVMGASTLIIGGLLGLLLMFGSWMPTAIMAALWAVGSIKKLLFNKGWLKKFVKRPELFDNDGLWYEHIATLVICLFLYIK